MEIMRDYPLRSLNTFNINVDGKYFAEVASVEDMAGVLDFAEELGLPLLVMGGGSNILFTRDFPGVVAGIRIMGVEVVGESTRDILVKAGAGENWDSFVGYCVQKGYGGLENLSLIPGAVGASPVQNIGAYGVEMKDHFESLEFYDFKTRKILEFRKDQCDFGYRNSIFKQELKGRGVVISVTYRLARHPEFVTSYGSIMEELAQMKVDSLSLEALREAVIRIRRSKLPDPAVTGNAGSFFKNPTIPAESYERLISKFPDLVAYHQPDNSFKVAAGWLIDQCGWKGYHDGDAGVHSRQALVLVNHGHASGEELYRLSEKIQASVMDRFGIQLEREVNVI